MEIGLEIVKPGSSPASAPDREQVPFEAALVTLPFFSGGVVLTLLGMVIDALPRAWRQKYAWTHRPRPPHSAHEASSTRRPIPGATACPAPPPAPAPSSRWAALEEVGACARRAAASGGTRWPARARARPGATKGQDGRWWASYHAVRGTLWSRTPCAQRRNAAGCGRSKEVRATSGGALHQQDCSPAPAPAASLPMTWSHGVSTSVGKGCLPTRGSISARLPAVANALVNISIW